MTQDLPKYDNQDGQMLLSLLVAIALFAILANALFTLVAGTYSLINFTSARIAARHLAQEKVEAIRNLPFDQIGTTGGIPDGSLEPLENIFRNGLNYQVSTSIVYIDDPFDLLAPNDLLPTDYKRVKINVSWEGLSASDKAPITLITDVAPRGIETTTGGGTLSILVFDANAQPVGQANVTIVASTTSPPIDLDLLTGDNGRLIVPGAPPCISCYEISVTKQGYSSERSYSVAEVANPDKPHLTILEGELTEISFAIDQLSDLTINTFSDKDSGFAPLGNITFDIRGDKTLGTDGSDELVYKYEQTITTNSQGTFAIQDLEWDNYSLTLPSGSSWDTSGSNPLLPISLLPDLSFTQDISLTEDSSSSLLTIFTDTADTPIASVAARIYDDLSFEATGSSGLSANPDFGQLFFSNLTDSLYHLEATISGYLNHFDDVSVSSDTIETIILNVN